MEKVHLRETSFFTAILCSPDSFFRSPNNHVVYKYVAANIAGKEWIKRYYICLLKTGDPTVSIFVYFINQQYIKKK